MSSAACWARAITARTFGGNPVSCAAALAVLEIIETDGLLGGGRPWSASSCPTASRPCRHPLLAGVRGQGLWLAAILTENAAADVEAAARRAGFLVNAVQPDAIRLAPPLILTAAEASAFLSALPAILDDAAAAQGHDDIRDQPGPSTAQRGEAGPGHAGPERPGRGTFSGTTI